jgi:WD40 repeat protein
MRQISLLLYWFLLTCTSLLAQQPQNDTNVLFPTTTTDAVASAFIQTGHTRDVLFIGWSPDGRLLASYSAADGCIKVWKAASGQLIWNIQAELLKPDQPLKSPDGKLLATGLYHKTYKISDAQSQNVIWTIEAHSTSAERVASPDGSMIADRVSYRNHAVKLLDAKTNQLLRLLEGHPGVIFATAFSPDGKTIATGSRDRAINLWNAEKGTLLNTLVGHTGEVVSLAFTRDGSTLVSASKDDTVKVWNVAAGQLLRSIQIHSSDGNGLSSLNVSRDGQTLIGANGIAVRIWDLAAGRELRSLQTNELHTSGEPGGMQTSWYGSKVLSVALSPNETLIVSAHEDGTIKLWDTKSARLIRIIKGRFRDLQVVTFSPDGKLIAGGYNESDSRVDLWSVRTGKRVMSLGEDSDYVYSLSFSPDGSLIATGHTFQDLIVWNARTGKPLRKFDQPYSQYDRIAFSPNGKFIVSGGENQNLLLWSVNSGNLLWSAIPIDWEAEKSMREEGKKRAAIRIKEEAEKKLKTAEADKVAAKWVRPVSINFQRRGRWHLVPPAKQFIIADPFFY